MLHLLDEMTDTHAEQAALVYHRYYEPFIAWAARALRPGGAVRYRAATATQQPSAEPGTRGLRVEGAGLEAARYAQLVAERDDEARAAAEILGVAQSVGWARPWGTLSLECPLRIVSAANDPDIPNTSPDFGKTAPPYLRTGGESP